MADDDRSSLGVREETEVDLVEGDFFGVNEWIFHGLYGWVWTSFQPYAEGGDHYFEACSGVPGVGGYSCSPTIETIDGYAFDAWEVTVSVSSDFAFGESYEYQGIFSDDLPLPIYTRIDTGSTSDYFEYELTHVKLA